MQQQYGTGVEQARGLSLVQVEERTALGHTNYVKQLSSRSVREILQSNVFTRFNAILGLLLAVVLLAGSPIDGLFGFVLVANSTIGVVQEWSAKRKLDRLAFLHAPLSRVIRDNHEIDIHSEEIVLDDWVVLRAGDQVPADGTIRTSDSLEINEANLTGEIEPVVKNSGDNVMSGTIVTAGSGVFITISVGHDAYAHRLAAEAKVFVRAPSEIQHSINTILRWVTWVLLVATPLQVWSHFRTDVSDGWEDHAVRTVAGLVGLVPEGLVLLATLAFLSAAVSLARQHVLVQELPAVEVLARVDVICLDKTGTITSGDVVFETCEFLVESQQQEIESAISSLAHDSAANNTLLAVSSAFSTSDWNEEVHIPFDSSRKWKASTYQHHGSWYLGAPEMLLPASSPLLARVNQLAETGRRVMLISQSLTTPATTQLPPDLTPMAFIVLREEIRDDAAETLNFFKEQGVQVMVLSGDNPHTVAAIAETVGLHSDTPVDARTLGTTPEELAVALSGNTIFGRVSPEQKRNIVHALQNSGHVVAMTGDGVNDALALKRADIGIAMNNGAPATKAVAQLVLLDGKFSHLPHVIAEGRRVIGNVERVANLFLAKNAMSLVAIVLAAIAGISFPILPRHMTLLSTLTIGIPAFVLALGPNNKRYQPGFLKRIIRFAWPAGAISGIAVVIADTWTSDQTGTAATATALLCFFSILILMAHPLRGWKLLLIAAMATCAITALAVPGPQDFFDLSVTTETVWKSLMTSLPACVVLFVLHQHHVHGRKY